MKIIVESDQYIEEASALEEKISGNDIQLEIRYGINGVFLTDGRMQMQGDLSAMISRITGHNLNRELLVRAAGRIREDRSAEQERVLPDNFDDISRILNQKHHIALDATAGMGEDSVLLAAAGYEVLMFEKDPVIAALVKDSIRRGRNIPELKEAACRMHIFEMNSIDVMKNFSRTCPDVVYLDPMFPERNKSGLVKKKFQLLHYLEKPCDDEAELLEAAVCAGPKKIIIKRPLKAPYLAGARPSYSLSGKTIRYDVIVKAQ